MQRPDLSVDIQESSEFVELMRDDVFCAELWVAFANIKWYKEVDLNDTDEENVRRILTGDYEGRTWGASFRGMGGVIADIRTVYLSKNEQYMDWYCSNHTFFDTDDIAAPLDPRAQYGHVTDRVREALEKLRWKPVRCSNYLRANCK